MAGGGVVGGFFLGVISISLFDVMVRCSVKVFETSAVKLKSPPAVITALPVISARASASEVTTVTPTDTGVPNSVGDVLRSLSETAEDSIVTSPPAFITTSPMSILAVASDSKTCTGGAAATSNLAARGEFFKNCLASKLNFAVINGRIVSAATEPINFPVSPLSAIWTASPPRLLKVVIGLLFRRDVSTSWIVT